MTRAKRIGAAVMAMVMVGDAIVPTVVLALSSGPSQPEVQGFQPAGVNDMVDLFSGDFSYNIPLLDVEGYPVNLFYSAGIGMDQEASWVGLGWNLNPGVVERNLRGLPDEFNGQDKITRTMGLRPNRTFGLSYGLGLQLFGTETSEFGLNANVGVSPSFNNYDGPQFETSFSLSMRSTLNSTHSMTAGLGLSSHSNSGLKVRPTIGFDRSTRKGEYQCKAGLNFGLTLDSRQGMTNMSLGATATSSRREVLYSNKDETIKTRDATGSRSTSVGTSFDLGSPTYTPQVTLPMDNLSLSFNFTLGPAVVGAHPNMTMGAFYSRQKLISNTISRPAYGYLHLHDGQSHAGAMLDFNREKDGPYSADRAALGIASLTNDLFSVSGQGVSGSYRAFRSDVGHVFDPSTTCTGSGGSPGLEFGAGFIAHVGGNVMVNGSSTVAGPWVGGNHAGQRLRYKALTGRPDLEPVFFREASEPTVEQDSTVWVAMGKDQALRFTLPAQGGFSNALGAHLTASGLVGTLALPQTNYRQKREPRAQLFSYLDHGSAMEFGLDRPIGHPAMVPPGSSLDEWSVVPKHHMSEVTITAKDGGRYVYGLPAYNLVQKDVEFNVDTDPPAPPVGGTPNLPVGDGFIEYSTEDNSTNNRKGKDHFYSCSTIPPYPYAFLLTAVLSPDYSDVDGQRGPSDGDLGNYTRFTYDTVSTRFPWRTPATGQANVARWNRGLPSNNMDDKASYTYGEKEVYHLRTIESRNLIAIFELNNDMIFSSQRKDAMGVRENGTVDTSKRSRYLKRISLYKKVPGMAVEDYATNARPIKTVHFEYMDQASSLCKNTPNAASGWGKLTLRKVWFSFGESSLGVTTPYEFSYNGTDPNYDMNGNDRWGNYQPNSGLGNDVFPYTDQGSTADVYASAWKLDKIRTPAGAIIKVVYEADDYAYVQNKPAMRMLRLKEFRETGGETADSLIHAQRLVFDLPLEIQSEPDPGRKQFLLERMFDGVQDIYFRVKVELTNGSWPMGDPHDHVSGYARRVGFGMQGSEGWVDLDPVSLDEGGGPLVSPIFRAGLEFARLNYPDRIHPGAPVFDGDDLDEAALYAFISSVSGFITGIGDFFHSPNGKLKRAGWCPRAEAEDSWIRVNEPDRAKKGGGYRVKSLRISDEWAGMEVDESDKAFTYGQDYTYGDPNGSFGVAAFEPMTGADENPWRQPVYGIKPTNALVPDERFYQETPFGESLFPGPVVGYSKVIVTDHFPSAEARAAHGTGRVVHEFYTAYDFPTITAMTNIQTAPQGNQQSVNLLALLGFKRVDHMHASQGYVVETNDMHGKPKRVAVYPQDGDEAISETLYTYATRDDGSGRLSNTATVIDPQGRIGRAEIGRQYEFVADMREFSTFSYSGGAEFNLESFPFAILPVTIPVVLPKYSSQSVQFKSGVLVKKIHRFGLLSSVTHVDNGSRVTTENLAYDSETGSVLLTKLTNAFEDPIYVMNFPAYWHYEAMGPAYRNIGAFATLELVAGAAPVANAAALFFPGDELAMYNSSGTIRGWVDRVDVDTIHVVDGMGNLVSGVWHARVIRSGRRNMQDMNMMSMTLLSDPLQGLSGNVYQNIVQVQVQEFGGEWATECACVNAAQPPNAWRLNQKGMWRPWRDKVWLTERTRSILNHNTDVRRDGVYSSFAPFYQVVNGHWQKHEAGWTTAREVTHYSPRGQELENMDALGLYSSATFGYRGNLPKTVARNARYQEIGFDGFEEPTDPVDCADRHFRFADGGTIVGSDAHTGRHSIRVTSSDTAWFGQVPWVCDPEPCALSAIVDPEGTAITVANAIGPFTIEVELISGDVEFQLTPTGLSVLGETAEGWSALVTVTNASCGFSELLLFDPGE